MKNKWKINCGKGREESENKGYERKIEKKKKRQERRGSKEEKKESYLRKG